MSPTPANDSCIRCSLHDQGGNIVRGGMEWEDGAMGESCVSEMEEEAEDGDDRWLFSLEMNIEVRSFGKSFLFLACIYMCVCERDHLFH